MAFEITIPQYVWQVASGEWFATATQTRYATRREAVEATRTWREAYAKQMEAWWAGN